MHQSSSSLQVPDWHPGVPSANRELFDTSCSGYTAGSCWIKNMEYWFKTLITSYPGVVGKLIVDLINVRLASVQCPDSLSNALALGSM